MLSGMAHNVAYFFAEKNVIEKEDVEVYAYGYEILFAEAINWLIAAVIAIATGSILITAVYMLSFMQLRESIGGFHAKTHTGCIALSTVVYAICLWLVYVIPESFYIPITAVGLAIHNISVFILAPVEHPNKPLSDKEVKRYRKRGRILSIVYSVVCIVLVLIQKSFLTGYGLAVLLGMLSASVSMDAEYILQKKRKNIKTNEERRKRDEEV